MKSKNWYEGHRPYIGYTKDKDLDLALSNASAYDLGILIDHLTDQGKGRISMSSSSLESLLVAKNLGDDSIKAKQLISNELRRFGGNSIMNLLRRGHGVPYQNIVQDVADHLKVNYTAGSDCQLIENAIMLKVIEESFDKMTDNERENLFEQFNGRYKSGAAPVVLATLLAAVQASGLGRYKLASLVANGVATSMLNRGINIGAHSALLRGAGSLAGPIGWAVTGLWAALDLASPAYRVTVPCVIQIAYMRQKVLTISIQKCSSCETPIQEGARFCSQCGALIN